MDYLIFLLTIFFIFAIAVFSFNLVAGFAGMFSLAQAGFVGVGAYTSALLILRLNWPFPFALLAAMFLSGVLAALFASIINKIRGDTFAVLTLWFAFVLTLVATNWVELTRGALGIPGVPRPEGFGSGPAFLFLSGLLAVVTFFALRFLTASRFGRVVEVCRDDEVAAATLGKNVWKTRVIVFAIGGAVAGLSGVLLGSFVGFVGPNSFTLPLLTQLIAYLIVGGLASLPGSVWGVALILIVREAARFLPFDSATVGALREIVLGLVLILVIMFRPRGLFGRTEIN